MRWVLAGLLVIAGLLLFTGSSPTVQREFDRHQGNDTARFEAIERALDQEVVRRRDDDFKGQQVLFRHESEIAKLAVRIDLVETCQREASSTMRQVFIGVFLAAIAAGLAAVTSHRNYRILRARITKEEERGKGDEP